MKEKLTNNIRRLRFEHGEMTQQRLAELVGVTRQTINALEADKYTPSLSLALRIAWTFGVAVEDAFDLAERGKGTNEDRAGAGE